MADRRKRNKEQTVQDILTAARHLFSKKGLHGTSIRDIEKASSVSKGLIIHHFETKEKLYAAVQDNLIQEYTAWMAEQREVGKDLREITTAAIRGALSYIKDNPEFRRITLWSYLEGQDRNTELEKRFTISLIEAMSAGQKSELVRDDIDAFLFPFIVRGTIDYWIRKEDLREEISVEFLENNTISDEDLVAALVKLMLR